MTSDVRCPRCAGLFRCGAADAAPCACSGVSLPAALLAELRSRYTGCLCLACLREVQSGAPKEKAGAVGDRPAGKD
ncbi:MAG TPA: cysteine-rich CWC family protein [Albitalea sp.]|jgi:hypothetical protein|nr:cysteine-rich CWC family protein [Albitalea sp.]